MAGRLYPGAGRPMDPHIPPTFIHVRQYVPHPTSAVPANPQPSIHGIIMIRLEYCATLMPICVKGGTAGCLRRGCDATTVAWFLGG